LVPPGGEANLETILGHSFRDPSLLERARSHSSLKQQTGLSNERLEFLGDAVISLVVSDYLYRAYPDAPEGELTQVKSVVVSRQWMTRICDMLGLEKYLLVGKGLDADSLPLSVRGNLVEALIGALYVDGGVGVAERFITRIFLPAILAATAVPEQRGDFKSLLQQLVQKRGGRNPDYKCLRVDGPDHDKTFWVAACIDDRVFPAGWGRRKKDAEQEAARLAYCTLKWEERPDKSAPSPAKAPSTRRMAVRTPVTSAVVLPPVTTEQESKRPGGRAARVVRDTTTTIPAARLVDSMDTMDLEDGLDRDVREEREARESAGSPQRDIADE
jgi:ribonuclease-3